MLFLPYLCLLILFQSLIDFNIQYFNFLIMSVLIIVKLFCILNYTVN